MLKKRLLRKKEVAASFLVLQLVNYLSLQLQKVSLGRRGVQCVLVFCVGQFSDGLLKGCGLMSLYLIDCGFKG